MNSQEAGIISKPSPPDALPPETTPDTTPDAAPTLPPDSPATSEATPDVPPPPPSATQPDPAGHPLHASRHEPIRAYFSKNSKDFIVRERALYEPSGRGEHLIVQIAKKDLTTFEAVKILSTASGARLRDFGYAGMKDRQGYTTQFVSLPRRFEAGLSGFSHPKLKILSTAAHENKLRLGHLRGNDFFIRLKKVLPSEARRLENVLRDMGRLGFANYFGVQRFGKFADNYEAGAALLSGQRREKNVRLRSLLISAFQSELFNRYLRRRMELSHLAGDLSVAELAELYGLSRQEAGGLKRQGHFFKLLPGEVLGHYPQGRCFICEDVAVEGGRFAARQISPLGLLPGERAYQAAGGSWAWQIEDEIYAPARPHLGAMSGGRRFLWGFLENLKFAYDEKRAQFTIEFFLQKGSYATVVLEGLGLRSF